MYYCTYGGTLEYLHTYFDMCMYKDYDSPACKIATRVLMPLSCKSFLLPPPFLSLFDKISKASAEYEAWISISRCRESHRDPKPLSVKNMIDFVQYMYNKLKIYLFFFGALAIAEASKTVSWNSWLAWLCV